ncbi:MAG: NTP transferase domain-containing protein [Fimbriimonadaceae bacterium]|nr:NTP transferase domain-containing protein [Fimbriimonadaceae bacterium]
MDVVILAGGRCAPDLAEAAGTEHRAMLPVGGRPMVEIVLAAVAHLGDPVVVGGPEGLAKRQVEGGRSFIESLGRGLGEVQTENFLLVTADLPFLTREGVDDFIARSDPSLLLNYPIVDVKVAEAAYPGMKRTAIKLREGRFTGGNVALMKTAAMRKALPIMEQAYAVRKKPFKLASMIGVRTLFRVVAGQVLPRTLTISVLEKAIAKFLGGPVRAVVTPFPEIGADIDTLEQWRAVSGASTRGRVDA